MPGAITSVLSMLMVNLLEVQKHIENSGVAPYRERHVWLPWPLRTMKETMA